MSEPFDPVHFGQSWTVLLGALAGMARSNGSAESPPGVAPAAAGAENVGSGAAAAAPVDLLRTLSLISDYGFRIHRELMLRGLGALQRQSSPASTDEPSPGGERAAPPSEGDNRASAEGSAAPPSAAPEDAQLLDLVRRAQSLFLIHPIAAQAAFAALVAEGRQFSTSEEGRKWKETLAGSGSFQRARSLWDAASLNMFEESKSAILPSSYIDVLVRAMDGRGFEQLLSVLIGKTGVSP